MQLISWQRPAAGIAAARARGIQHTGHCRASGNDLTAQNDEPEPGNLTEQDLMAVDRELNEDKAGRAARANEARALELQIRRAPGHWR
jgi:hypothetical protein